MGGWNIIYALINFAILALGLYLFAKKIVLTNRKNGMYFSKGSNEPFLPEKRALSIMPPLPVSKT